MNNDDRMFSIIDSPGSNFILMKDGELYTVVGEWARPLTGGDVEVYPDDSGQYVYMQEVLGERYPRWELAEIPVSEFEISPRPDSWPGYHVQRRAMSTRP
jgi:hypothetical protein